MTEEVQNDAAPSSTEPVGNVVGGASSDTPAQDASVQGATDGESAGEQGNGVAAASDGAQAAGDAPAAGGEAGNAASAAAGLSTAAASFAVAASSADGALQTAESSGAEFTACNGCDNATDCTAKAKCFRDVISRGSGSQDVPISDFEKRVEERFLALEGYLMKLPHSIAHAFSQGSADPEELASRVLSHLFSK